MTKDLSKTIKNLSNTKNKYLNWPSRGIFISYKRTKNECNFLTKEATKDGIMTSKIIWRTVEIQIMAISLMTS